MRPILNICPTAPAIACATSVKQAMYFKNNNPNVDTVVMFTDLRLPGMGEDFYRSAQEKGVIFTKGKASSVDTNSDGCKVNFRDLILDEDTTVAADLVVLATGQVPSAGVDLEAWNPIVTAADGGSEEPSKRKWRCRRFPFSTSTIAKDRTYRS